MGCGVLKREGFTSFVFFDKGQRGASEGIDGAEQLRVVYWER